jgi:uroporphyrin-III C-methyltransferase
MRVGAIRVGTVALVGAGPGDPGLMTVRGLQLLRRADVVVYDRLVDRRLLREAPRARRIFAGKMRGHHTLPQEQINALLIAHAQQGRRVVRLKGGDPFVFGRGGEEADALGAAGVPFEVVPGVSSAIAAPAYAGIPVTHRGVASSFAVVTGHECAEGGDRVDWTRLATAVDTLVVLMGVAALPRIASDLIAHGRAPETPVALVRYGTTGSQTVLRGRLDDVAARAHAAGVEPPVVIVIGNVVGLAERLAWFTPDAVAPRSGSVAPQAASASSRRTSSSVVSEKSSYEAPTATNGSGISAHTTSSATAFRSTHASADAVGTAATMRDGPSRRRAATAARMVAPVARPSSTRITTLPRTSRAGRSPR